MRKILKTLISMIALSLIISPVIPVGGREEQIGVRIPASAYHARQLNQLKTDVAVNYGSFVWIVISLSDLAELDRVGILHQDYPNPYELTLGGKTFDPLNTLPTYDNEDSHERGASQPGLHLVQLIGPTKPAWLDIIKSSGLEVVQYIHPFTYVVWGDRATLTGLTSRTFTRWVGEFLPDYAIQPNTYNRSNELTPVQLLLYPAAGLAETTKALEGLGGLNIQTQAGLHPVFDIITGVLPGGSLALAASLPGVYAIQPFPTDGGLRGEMSAQVNANNINNAKIAFPGYQSWLNGLGLSGTNVVIANVDNGIDQNHPDLVSRIKTCNGPTCGGAAAADHGTHTAGIMAGDGSSGVVDALGFLRGLGVAPGARLVEQLYAPFYQNPGGVLTLMAESHRNEAVISSNSWGPAGTPQGYDTYSRLVDIGVRDADPNEAGEQPLTYVVSIMNGYGGTSSQGSPDEAKNSFSVGSTFMQQYPSGNQNLQINDISSNSAHGPALDGRNLPDIVAPGSYVDSTMSLPKNGYNLKSGTSMAAPQVSGAAALFYEWYRNQFSGVDPSPAMVKAVFLPVAHDLAGHKDANGFTLGHPFDSKQGWGRLNLANVFNPPGSTFYFDQKHIFTETGQTWSYLINPDEPIQGLRAMLVWTDAPGHGLGGSTPAWVNDLDLSIEVDGQIYYGNNFGADGLSLPGGAPDRKNNTEGIFLGALPAGNYILTVMAANLSGDGVPSKSGATDQDFALVIYFDGEFSEPLYRFIFPIFFY